MCGMSLDTEDDKGSAFRHFSTKGRVILSFRSSRILRLLTLVLTSTEAAVWGGRVWDGMEWVRLMGYRVSWKERGRMEEIVEKWEWRVKREVDQDGKQSQCPVSWGVYLGNSSDITLILGRSLPAAQRVSRLGLASMAAWSLRKSRVWQESMCSLEQPSGVLGVKAEHCVKEGSSPSPSSLLSHASPDSVCSIKRLYGPPSAGPFSTLQGFKESIKRWSG